MHRPGYIAGVTNPIFELHGESWDVFCNIETGKITVSKALLTDASAERPSGDPITPVGDTGGSIAASRADGKDSMDNVFMEEASRFLFRCADPRAHRGRRSHKLSRHTLARPSSDLASPTTFSVSSGWRRDTKRPCTEQLASAHRVVRFQATSSGPASSSQTNLPPSERCRPTLGG